LYTPAEIYDLFQGYEERLQGEWERLATHACWIVNQAGMRSGKALHPRDLIGFRDKKKDDDGPKSRKEAQEMIDAIAWQHKQREWSAFSDRYIPKETKDNK